MTDPIPVEGAAAEDALPRTDFDLEAELEACWEANARLGPLQRWMKALREAVLPSLVEGSGLRLRVQGSETNANPERRTLNPES